MNSMLVHVFCLFVIESLFHMFFMANKRYVEQNPLSVYITFEIRFHETVIFIMIFHFDNLRASISTYLLDQKFNNFVVSDKCGKIV